MFETFVPLCLVYVPYSIIMFFPLMELPGVHWWFCLFLLYQSLIVRTSAKLCICGRPFMFQKIWIIICSRSLSRHLPRARDDVSRMGRGDDHYPHSRLSGWPAQNADNAPQDRDHRAIAVEHGALTIDQKYSFIKNRNRYLLRQFKWNERMKELRIERIEAISCLFAPRQLIANAACTWT